MSATPMPAGGDAAAVNPFAAGCACIEGEYVPFNEARIPIADTGFTRSDCTYDVVAVWDGSFFRLDDHLARFQRAIERNRYQPPLGIDAMREALFECVRRSALREAYVEMIVTRGIAPPGDRNPLNFSNRFYAFAIPYVWILPPDRHAGGLHMVIARDTRRIEPHSVDPRVKNFHWGDLTRGLLEAQDREAESVVLLNAAGEVTEGPGFNVFAWYEDQLWTPDSGVLEGITRSTVLELAAREGLPIRETMFGAEVLANASEVFITSTAGGVIAVTRLDGAVVGTGRPGAVTTRLHDAYWAAHRDGPWSTPVNYA